MERQGATGSFMLPFTLLLDLFVWCLIHKGVHSRSPLLPRQGAWPPWVGEALGLEKDASPYERELWDKHLEFMKEIGKQIRMVRVYTNQPGHGTRCTHAMSGRTE